MNINFKAIFITTLIVTGIVLGLSLWIYLITLNPAFILLVPIIFLFTVVYQVVEGTL